MYFNGLNTRSGTIDAMVHESSRRVSAVESHQSLEEQQKASKRNGIAASLERMTTWQDKKRQR